MVEKESQKTCVMRVSVIWMFLIMLIIFWQGKAHAFAIIRLKIDPSGPLQVGCSGSNLSNKFLMMRMRHRKYHWNWYFWILKLRKQIVYDLAAWYINPLEAWPRQPVGILRHACWRYVSTLESWWSMSNISCIWELSKRSLTGAFIAKVLGYAIISLG